ncbi:methyltransferase-like protein 2 isoform X2 [Carex littledalei]|uniref:Methyltransferase-like protein 2 isoform X2 n=1 Tax=Carex littledalei TaxID=544730 RepID=A0A833RG93_9POAL|nr:methyltransferase-like protein 2 isoform X2 [Carex littledalei]
MEPQAQQSELLNSFMESGIYRLDHSDVVFIDPVRLLNDSYSRFRLSPSAYYSRHFSSSSSPTPNKKRKRKRKPKHASLNERELCAEKRHQQLRPLLLNAHRKLLQASQLLNILPRIIVETGEPLHCRQLELERLAEHNFVELGSNWRAPFCEISLSNNPQGLGSGLPEARKLVPLFDNMISVESDGDVEAEFQNSTYILPQRSFFLMSDLRHVRKLIPENSTEGFNFIVIDPPWENGSARQKAMYPTLPNRHFMYLPVKELAHSDGALVALWMTNRQKLQDFVEKDLLPAWGMSHVTPFYWLKVKPDGSLIGDLDLFHHRPYECLLLGYVNVDLNSECMKTIDSLKESRVIISVPGAYSRKPPLEKLLSEYIPGQRPSRCIELFGRELAAGWTSWGNEPLHFQDSRYFLEK